MSVRMRSGIYLLFVRVGLFKQREMDFDQVNEERGVFRGAVVFFFLEISLCNFNGSRSAEIFPDYG